MELLNLSVDWEAVRAEEAADKGAQISNAEKAHRNTALVFGCLAEKLAGPRSIAIFFDKTLDYLVANLVSENPTQRKAKLVFFSSVSLSTPDRLGFPAITAFSFELCFVSSGSFSCSAVRHLIFPDCPGKICANF